MTLRRFVNMFASRNHSSESSDLPITKLSQLDSQGKVGFLILWEPLLVSYLVEFQQFLAVLEQLLPCLTVKLHYTDTLNGDGFCHGIMGEILDTLLWNTHTHTYIYMYIQGFGLGACSGPTHVHLSGSLAILLRADRLLLASCSRFLPLVL